MSVALAAFALAGLWCLLWLPFWECCCNCTTVVTVTISGCSFVKIPGATVLIKVSGTTVASGTTDSLGKVILSPSTAFPVSATVEVPAYGGFAAYSVGTTLNCTPVSIGVPLSADSDHVCTSCCSDGFPAPKSIPITTAIGSGTLVWNGGTWEAIIETSADVHDCDGYFEDCPCAPDPIPALMYDISSGTASALFILSCGGGGFALTVKDAYAGFMTACSVYEWAYTAASCGTHWRSHSVTLSGSCTAGVLALSGTVGSGASYAGDDCLPACFTDTVVCPWEPYPYDDIPYLASGSVTIG